MCVFVCRCVCSRLVGCQLVDSNSPWHQNQGHTHTYKNTHTHTHTHTEFIVEFTGLSPTQWPSICCHGNVSPTLSISASICSRCRWDSNVRYWQTKPAVFAQQLQSWSFSPARVWQFKLKVIKVVTVSPCAALVWVAYSQCVRTRFVLLFIFCNETSAGESCCEVMRGSSGKVMKMCSDFREVVVLYPYTVIIKKILLFILMF